MPLSERFRIFTNLSSNNPNTESTNQLIHQTTPHRPKSRIYFKTIGKLVMPKFFTENNNLSNINNNTNSNSIITNNNNNNNNNNNINNNTTNNKDVSKRKIGKIKSTFLLSSTPIYNGDSDDFNCDSGKENYDSGGELTTNHQQSTNKTMTTSMNKSILVSSVSIVDNKFAKYFGIETTKNHCLNVIPCANTPISIDSEMSDSFKEDTLNTITEFDELDLTNDDISQIDEEFDKLFAGAVIT